MMDWVMDGLGWMNGGMDKQIDFWLDLGGGYTLDGLVEQMDGFMYGFMYAWMGWMYGQ